MTDREIAVMYKQAANKSNQIKIIADLNVKSVKQAKQKIMELGFDLPVKTQDNNTDIFWSEEEIKTLVQLRDGDGLSFEEIAIYLPKHSVRACGRKYYNLKMEEKPLRNAV